MLETLSILRYQPGVSLAVTMRQVQTISRKEQRQKHVWVVGFILMKMERTPVAVLLLCGGKAETLNK